MKAIRNGLLVFIPVLLVVSCFDPPVYPNVPAIDLADVYFGPSATTNGKDSLVVVMNFKDGDGDLGLEETDIEPPFHDANFYLADKNTGTLTAVQKQTRYTNLPQFLDIPDGAKGVLARVRTRQDLPSMPAFVDLTTSCKNYHYDSVFISQEDASVFDGTYTIKRKLTSPTLPSVFVLVDTFYYQKNEFHNNIIVKFYTQSASGKYDVEYTDLYRDCNPGYDARYPKLSDKNSTLEGKLTYSMSAARNSFQLAFGSKSFVIKVFIRDRALHSSNTLEIGPYSLDKLKR